MSKNIKISNSTLTCEISTLGAELKSVKKGGKEFIWQGDKKYWTGSAPILFPICGGVMDDKYTYQGKEYTLYKHGFARNSEFEVAEASAEKAVFLLKSSDATRAQYPFDFEFKVTFSLCGNKLVVDYETKNLTDGEMLYAVGAHEAYACPEGIEEYSVVFEEEENFEASTLFGNLLGLDTTPVIPRGRELPLKTEYFAIDALVFLNLKSRCAELVNRKSGDRIKLSYPEHDYFLIWQKPGAGYICLEPWCCTPDFVNSNQRFEDKLGMIKLGKGESDKRSHTIEF